MALGLEVISHNLYPACKTGNNLYVHLIVRQQSVSRRIQSKSRMQYTRKRKINLSREECMYAIRILSSIQTKGTRGFTYGLVHLGTLRCDCPNGTIHVIGNDSILLLKFLFSQDSVFLYATDSYDNLCNMFQEKQKLRLEGLETSQDRFLHLTFIICQYNGSCL